MTPTKPSWNTTTLCHSVLSCWSPFLSFHFSDVAKLKVANFPPVLLEFSSEQELARAHGMMTEVIAQKTEPYINGVLSIFSILPRDQKERVAHIQNIVDSLNHENSKFLPQKVQGNLSALRNLKPEVLTKNQLPVSIRQLIGGETNRLLLFPQGNMWDVQENNKMAQSIAPYLENDRALGLTQDHICLINVLYF